MKVFAALLAASASLWSVPAAATTIVQSDDEFISRGFSPFDRSLGTLDSVTLSIDLFKARGWVVSVPSAVPTTTSVSWLVNGIWNLPASTFTGGSAINVPLTGSGTSLVNLNMLDGGRAFGYFGTDVRGSTSLILNPSAFLGAGRIFFNGFDTGFFGTGADTTITAASGTTVNRLSGACFGLNGPSGTAEDLCGSARYQLTYNFTPFSAAAPVPEPGTWAMMLLGFAGVGAALRRSRKRAGAALA